MITERKFSYIRLLHAQLTKDYDIYIYFLLLPNARQCTFQYFPAYRIIDIKQIVQADLKIESKAVRLKQVLVKPVREMKRI
jgi:hypothetical protein